MSHNNNIDTTNMKPEDVAWLQEHLHHVLQKAVATTPTGNQITLVLKPEITLVLNDEIMNSKQSNTRIYVQGGGIFAFKGSIPDLIKAGFEVSSTGSTFIFYGIRQQIVKSSLNITKFSARPHGATFEFIGMTVDNIDELIRDSLNCTFKFVNCKVSGFSHQIEPFQSTISLHECSGSDELKIINPKATVIVERCNYASVNIVCNKLDITEMRNPFVLQAKCEFSLNVNSSTIADFKDVVCKFAKYVDCTIDEFKCTHRSDIKSILLDVDTIQTIEHGWQYFVSPKIVDVSFAGMRLTDSRTIKHNASEHNNILRDTTPHINDLIKMIHKYRQTVPNRNMMQFIEDMIENGFEDYV